ncbi:MAG: PilZ domain-containing protein [Planctomycetales bacterium]|nr:PilZ domain-containing protein [Planctomycetales bacterium]
MRVLKRGMIGFRGQFAACPCVIRNISKHGALIELFDPLALPRRFTVHIEIDGIKADCELVWQSKNLAGVQFEGEMEQTMVHRRQVVRASENALPDHSERDERQRQWREHLARRQAEKQLQEEQRKERQEAIRATVSTPLHRKAAAFGRRRFGG